MHTIIRSLKSRPLACIALCLLALSFNSVADPDVDTRRRVLALYEESSSHYVKASRLREDAESELDNCARVHERYHWWEDVVEACTKAQRKVDECNAFRADWERRRTVVLAEIEKQSPGIGQEYTERVVAKGEFGTPMLDPKTGKPITEASNAYNLKGDKSNLDSDQRWNDVVRGLRNLELRTCPGAVPGVSSSDGGFGTPLSPTEALEYWKKRDSKPLTRSTSSATASMLAAAVDEANDEGVIRDAEEAAAEKERQRLAKIKEEQDRLARIAAEKAAKEQARLLAQQEAEQAREDAEQEREDRAAAKQQAKTAGNSTRSSNSGSSSGGKSICMRNYEKYVADYSKENVLIYPMTGDPFQEQIYTAVGKLFEPCLSFDPESRRYYEQILSNNRVSQNYCAGPHTSRECQQWGMQGHEQDNQRGLAWAQAKVAQLLAGSSGTTNAAASHSGGDNGDASQSSSGKESNVSAAACRDGLAKLDKEGSAINARRPANAETVPSIQVEMYIIGKRMTFMDSSCRGQPEYGDYAGLKKAYDQLMLTCQQVTSSPSYCVAKVAW